MGSSDTPESTWYWPEKETTRGSRRDFLKGDGARDALGPDVRRTTCSAAGSTKRNGPLDRIRMIFAGVEPETTLRLESLYCASRLLPYREGQLPRASAR